jgi:hypothetical protein
LIAISVSEYLFCPFVREIVMPIRPFLLWIAAFSAPIALAEDLPGTPASDNSSSAQAGATPDDQPNPGAPSGGQLGASMTGEYSAAGDPTGGAFTTPTLLFTPAAAVPKWTVRVITSLDMQGPTAADRLAAGTSVGFQPGVGGELGLPGGFTVGAGTQWVGGDVSPSPASAGISPYLQVRYHILGDPNGQGFGLGTSVTYKFVGFQGDPGEMELAFSGQYRQHNFEVGLEGVVGKDFATTDADAEGHAYAVYRVIPQLALGVAAQVRQALISQPGETKYDIISGGIASLTLGRWQVGALVGESTVGLNQGQMGALGEVFGSARF